jgi:P-loop containing NTP hydrolase pore-1/C-terminal domain on Strawberry notch homologue
MAAAPKLATEPPFTEEDDQERQDSVPAEQNPPDEENPAPAADTEPNPPGPPPGNKPLPSPVGRQATLPRVPGAASIDDPNARHADVLSQLAQRTTDQFREAHPFLPSGWAPEPGAAETQYALTQSDRQARLAAQQRRQQVTSQRQARLDKIRAQNAQAEEQMRATGQRFYTDPYGQIQPILEPETNRPLYHPSPWEEGVNPRTGETTLTRRDQYGQRQFKRPPIVASPDLTDEQLYYRMPSGDMKPAGRIEDLVKSPDFQVARMAMRAKRQRRAAMWKEALDPVQQLADFSKAQAEQAQLRSGDLQGQIDDLSKKLDAIPDSQLNETKGGFMGIGSEPTDSALQAQANKASIESQLASAQQEKSELDASLKPTGLLARERRATAINLALYKAKAAHDLHADMSDERRAILRQLGLSEDTDPTLQAILQQQAVHGNTIDHLAGRAQKESAAAMGAAMLTAPGGPKGPPVAAGPGPQNAPPEIQNEPAGLAARGITHVGPVSVEELSRRYGTGAGQVNPLSLLKIRQRVNDINDTLTNKGTKIDNRLRDALTAEGDYLNRLYDQRFARLPVDQQRRVTEATRPPTAWETVKANVGNYAQQSGTTATSILQGLGKMVARSAALMQPGGPQLLLGGIDNSTAADIDKYAQWEKDAIAASNAPTTAPEAKARQTVSARISGTIGGFVPYMVAGAPARLAGLGTTAETLLSGAAGAFGFGQSFRDEAVKGLQQQLQDGKITRGQYDLGADQAEAMGTIIGAGMTVPFSRFARALAGTPAGKTVVSSILGRLGSGGEEAAMKWIAGPEAEGLFRRAMTGSTAGAITGFGQAVASNMTAQGKFGNVAYDPSRKTFEGATEAALGLGLLGAMHSAMVRGFSFKQGVQKLDEAFPSLFWKITGTTPEEFATRYADVLSRFKTASATPEDTEFMRTVHDAAKQAGVSVGDLARGRAIIQEMNFEPRATQAVLPKSLRPTPRKGGIRVSRGAAPEPESAAAAPEPEAGAVSPEDRAFGQALTPEQHETEAKALLALGRPKEEVDKMSAEEVHAALQNHADDVAEAAQAAGEVTPPAEGEPPAAAGETAPVKPPAPAGAPATEAPRTLADHEAALEQSDPEKLAYLRESRDAHEITPEEYAAQVTEAAQSAQPSPEQPQTGEPTHANVTGGKPIGHQPEHPGNAPRPVIPEGEGAPRGGGGEQNGGRGGIQQRPEAPEGGGKAEAGPKTVQPELEPTSVQLTSAEAAERRSLERAMQAAKNVGDSERYGRLKERWDKLNEDITKRAASGAPEKPAIKVRAPAVREDVAGKIEDLARLNPEEFRDWQDRFMDPSVRGAFTHDAQATGIRAIGHPEVIEKLREAHEQAKAEFRTEMKKGTPEGHELASAIASGKLHYFSDALQAATNTGAAAETEEVKAAHAAAAKAVEGKPEPEGEKALEVQKAPTPERQELRDLIVAPANHAKKAIQMRQIAVRRGVDVKTVQEQVEAELVTIVNELANVAGTDPKTLFNQAIALYERQPLFSARTSTSIENQAYGTPAPLAVVGKLITGVTPKVTMYEPTAGNGMLMVGADLEDSMANELNDLRAAALRALGVGKVVQHDAREFVPSISFEVVHVNAPFGSIDNVNYDGFGIRRLEHLISLRALEAMDDDGAAFLIIAANREEGPTAKGAEWVFENYLYGHYNVADNFEISGDLYGNQGAKWPVRVIAISGRKAVTVTGELAPKTVDRLGNWSDVWRRAEKAKDEVDRIRKSLVAGKPSGVPAGPATGPKAAGESGIVPAGGGRPAGPARGGGKPAGAGGRKPAVAPQPAGGGANVAPAAPAGRPEVPQGAAHEPVLAGKSPATLEGGGAAGAPVAAHAGAAGAPVGKRPESGKFSGTSPVEGEERQISYVPRSGGEPFNTLTPVNIGTGTHKALDELKARVGSIDDFVSDRMHMPVEMIHDGMSADQIDGVALAIDQIERGGALIIGDQTGIGKGRQGAGALHYAKVNGKLGVFFTKDPKLFSDMWGDLKDIHSGLKPLILGDPAKASIIAPDGAVILRAPGLAAQRSAMDAIEKDGMKQAGYDSIFVTYSQVNQRNQRQQFLEKLAAANDTVLVLDEAHEAAGDGDSSMQAAFMQGGTIKRGKGSNIETIRLPGLLRAAGTRIGRGGVVYLSATYAKRPDNMPLYARTDLSKAADNFTDVVNAMKAGGVALQQALSEALAANGQYIRRERDFAGVKYSQKVIGLTNQKEITEHVDRVTEQLRAIVDFSKAVRSKFQTSGGKGKSTAMTQAQIDVTDFAAIVHNQVSQLLLAAKADDVVAEAIAAHQRGEKPVITMMNTMESFLDHYAEDHGLKHGTPITLTWRELLAHALQRTLRTTEKQPNGDTVIRTLTPDELEEAGLKDKFDSVMEDIKALEVKFPVSPIDHILQKLKAAGIKMGELTGRHSGIDYTDFEKGHGTYKLFKPANKNTLVNAFNSGGLDGMLMNASGAIGLSAHASEKFKDKRKRHMIIVQPALDINTFVQTLGRIMRTGMIPGGAEYTHLVLPLQAELRPAAVANRKMKSLNANTTAEAEGAVKIPAVEMLNKYGDKVVAEYLDGDLSLQIDLDLDVDHDQDGMPIGSTDLARKFTGRLSLLPDEFQHEIYSAIIPAYNEYVEQLRTTGDYDLDIVVHDDWDGVMENDLLLKPGKNEANILTASIRAQRWEITDKRKVPTGEQMKREFERNTGGVDKFNADWEDYKKRADERLESDIEKAKAQLAEAEAIPKENPGRILAVSVSTSRLQSIQDYARVWHDTAGKLDRIFMRNGEPVTIEDTEAHEEYEGMLVGVKFPELSARRPLRLSPGRFQFRYLVNQPGGRMFISGAQFTKGKFSQYPSNMALSDFTGARGDNRYRRWIVTGNPIGAYKATGGRGKMVRFKTRDGPVVTGLLMPRNWDVSKLSADPRFTLITPEAAAKFLTSQNRYGQTIGVEAASGTVRISFGRHEGNFILTTPSSAKSRDFFLDPKLRSLLGDFHKIGSRMQVLLPEDDLGKVITRIVAIAGEQMRAAGTGQSVMEMVKAANGVKGQGTTGRSLAPQPGTLESSGSGHPAPAPAPRTAPRAPTAEEQARAGRLAEPLSLPQQTLPMEVSGLRQPERDRLRRLASEIPAKIIELNDIAYGPYDTHYASTDEEKEAERRAKQLQTFLDRIEAKLEEIEKAGVEKAIATRDLVPEAPQPSRQDIIKRLQGLKIHKPGTLAAATPFSLAWDAGIDVAIMVIRAGRAIQRAIAAAMGRFRERYPGATKEEMGRLQRALADNLGAAENLRTKGATFAKAAAKSVVSTPEFTPLKAAVNKFEGMSAAGKMFVRNKLVAPIREAVPSRETREAINAWLEAGGSREQLEEWRDGSLANPKTKQYAARYERAMNLTPGEVEVAKKIEAHYAAKLRQGKREGILGEGIQNFVNHWWSVDTNGGNFAERHSGQLTQFFQSALKRTFPSSYEGEQAGMKARTYDIADLVGAYTDAFNRVSNSRKFIKDLTNKKAADGRPLAYPSGMFHATGGEPTAEDESSPVFIKPNQKPADVSDYRVLDHPALHKWKWAGEIDGRPVMLQGNLALHPDAYHQVKNLLGESAIREWYRSPSSPLGTVFKGVVRAVDRSNSLFKEMSLGFLSPFHAVQEGTHAVGHRINPFGAIPDIDPETNREMLYAMTHGLVLGEGSKGITDFMEGFAGTHNPLYRVPVVGEWARAFSDWLFRNYIPGLKFKTWQAMVRRNTKLYGGKLSKDDIAYLSALQSNNAYGGLNYADMGRNPTLQHLLRMTLLAPDFLEARGRFAAEGAQGVVSKSGREQTVALAVLAAAFWIVARILNELLDGDPHWDDPFVVVHASRRYMLRSVPEDMWRLFSDSRAFIYNRLSPVLGHGSIELLTGKNFRGEKISFTDGLRDIATRAIPIWINAMPGVRNLSTTGQNTPIDWWEQFLGTMGLQIKRRSPYFEAYKLAGEYRRTLGDKEDTGTYPVSRYQQLRYALEDGDLKRAKSEADKLIEEERRAHPGAERTWFNIGREAAVKKIAQGFHQSLMRPWTKTKEMDVDFMKSLSPADRATVLKAIKQRELIWRRFSGVMHIPAGTP